MTVSTDTASVSYATNGTVGPFAVPFYFLENTDLRAAFTETATGVEQLLALGTHYTVTGAGNQAGGALTLSVAKASGFTLSIERDLDLTQLFDPENGDPLDAQSLERALDKLTMLAQQLNRLANASLRVPETAAGLSALPLAASRANKTLAFDSMGRPTVLVPEPGTAASVLVDLASSSDSAKGDALVSLKRSETGAVARTLHFYVQHSKLLVANFCDPTSDTAAQVATNLAAAITAAKASGKALEFEPGATYTMNAELAILGANGLKGLRLWGNGATLYRNTGAGPVCSLDAGASGNRGDDHEFLDFVLRGNASSTYGLYTRGLVRSKVRGRAYDIATAGFKVDYAVLSIHDLMVSNNVDTFAVNPTKGLIVDQSGVGFYSAANKFHVVMEGPISDIGVDLVQASLGNVFTGTCEGIPRGLRAQSTSGDNVLDSMDFEQNTDYDVLAEGKGLELRDCNLQSAGATGTLVVASTARNTTIHGGYVRWAALNASSLTTRFTDVRVSDNASLGITGPTAGSAPANGIHQARGCIKVDTNQVPTALVPDVLSPLGTWTPALSTGSGTQGAVTKAVGTYRLVGGLCHLSGNVVIAKGTLGAGSVSITGLPFNARSTTDAVQFLRVGEWQSVNLAAGMTDLTLRISPSGNTGALIQSGDSVASAGVALADLPDPVNLQFSGVYEVT